MSESFSSTSVLRAYYFATVLFLLLDIVFNVNVRIAFLESHTTLRALYYAVIFACMALMLWRPGWTVAISAIESLVTLVALILSMGMRTMLVTDEMLDGGGGFVTMPEIINFMITGSIAYVAFMRGMKELRGL
jgi:hypothetical protein